MKHTFVKKAGIQYYWCRNCTSETLRNYYIIASEKIKGSVKRYAERNPIRVRSWRKAQAIKRTPCIICENPKSLRHHPDSTKPLVIVCLCHAHHSEEHRLMRVGQSLV